VSKQLPSVDPNGVRVIGRSFMNLYEKREPLDVKKSDLSGSSFSDVDISGSTFKNVNIAGASFDDTNMSGWRVHDIKACK
jgi:uncharacterized protein YjbI with pentapeptide repeats